MRVLITGGAGFIGANLCRALLEAQAGMSVVVFDDLSSGRLSNLDGLDVEMIEACVLDRTALARAMSGIDSVVHLAARGSVPRSVADPVGSVNVNTMGTLNVLEACRAAGINHLVFASSSSVYGMNMTLPKHEDLAPQPASPYAASKLAAESLVLAYAATYRLKTLAFRFFNVYGPLQPADHDYAAVVPRFLDAALRDEPVIVYGDGRQSRDFTYVDTLTAIVVQALARGVSNPGPINLAFGGRTDLLTLIQLIERELGFRVAREHEPARSSDVRHSQASGARLRELFPDVQPTALDVGLRRTVAWHQAQSMLSSLVRSSD